jgi:hypothetical protein
MDALVAAIKAASREAAEEAIAAASKKPLVDDATGDPLSPEDAAMAPDDVTAAPPAPAVPVDMEAAKAALKARFGGKPKKKAKAKPPVAPVAPVPVTAAALRDRIAARSGS